MVVVVTQHEMRNPPSHLQWGRGVVPVVTENRMRMSCPHHHHPAALTIIVVLCCCHLVLLSPPGCCHHSTCYPPHEQLLMRLGVGGVSFVAVVTQKRRTEPSAHFCNEGGRVVIIVTAQMSFLLPVVAQNSIRDTSTRIFKWGRWWLPRVVIINVDVDGFGVIDSDQQCHMIRYLTGCQYL